MDDVPNGSLCEKGDMGRQDHIFHSHELLHHRIAQVHPGAVFPHKGLLVVVDIRRKPGDLAALESVQHVCKIHETSSGGIHQIDPVPHLRDSLCVDHVPVLLVQRALQHDQLGLPEHRFFRNVFHIGLRRLPGVGIIRQDPAAHGFEQLGLPCAQAARSKQAHRHGPKLLSLDAAEAEVLFLQHLRLSFKISKEVQRQ